MLQKILVQELFKADRKIMYRVTQKSRDTRCLTTQGQYIWSFCLYIFCQHFRDDKTRCQCREERHFQQANKYK